MKVARQISCQNCVVVLCLFSGRIAPIVVSVAVTAGREGVTAKRNRREIAPQRLEKIESAPENGMVSEASNPQGLVCGRSVDRAPFRLTAQPSPSLRDTSGSPGSGSWKGTKRTEKGA